VVSSTNETDRHDITKTLLKVTLTTIKQTNKQTKTNNKPTLSHNAVHLALIEIRTHNIGGDRH
jgi:hypothetical protein